MINNGIKTIEFAPINSDGGAGTAFFTLGKTKEDSFKWEFADDEVKEFPVEEDAEPIKINVKKGAKGFSFTLETPDEDTMVKVFGGKKTGNAGTTSYEFPENAGNIEYTVKITPNQGMGILMTRVLISGKMTADMGRNHLWGVEVKGSVLKPTKANEPSAKTFRVV